jgi:hypothetical protein
VGRPGGECPTFPDVHLEAFRGHPAPIGVVHGTERRALVVLVGLDRLGDDRAPAVGTDDHPRPLGHRLLARCPAAQLHAVPVPEDHFVHVESLADLGAVARRGLDEQGVDDGPARSVCLGHYAARAGRPRDRERPEVERVAGDGRTAGRGEWFPQSPSFERGHARGMDEVGGQGVARERGLVDQEHAVTVAGQEHGGRGAGAPGADHDDVVRVGHLSPICAAVAVAHIGQITYANPDFWLRVRSA